MALSQEIASAWKCVHAVCRGAAMFLDDPAAELLHWTGAERIMRDAIAVYHLYEQLNPLARDVIARAPYSHVVVVVTAPLQGRCAEAIAGLLSDLQPLECHVFCSLSEGMHEEHVPLGGAGEGGDEKYSHYGEFQALIRKWINRESGVRVTVNHVGLFFAEVFPGLVITPAHACLSSLLPSDIPSLQLNMSEDDQLNSLEEIHFPWLPRPLQLRIKSFASAFSTFLEQMDMKEDLFSLGPTSRVIASQMAFLPEARARRKSASQRCSVLLVDRSLDLTAPCLHSGDHLADKMLGLLPALSRGSSDIAIDMSPICEGDPQLLVPGCLAQPNDQKTRVLFQSLLQSKQKEAMMEVMRCLLEALSKEKLSVRSTGRMGRPSSSQLRGFLSQFRSHGKSVEAHSGLLQLACGTVAALDHPLCNQWEQLASDEQVLLMSHSEQDTPSLLHQLSDLLKRKKMRVVDVLTVAVAMYSLVGEDSYTHHSEESQMKVDLADLITKRRECDMPFLQELGVDDGSSHEHILERLDSVFECLNAMGHCRERLEQLSETYTPQSSSPYTPLLERLLEAILDPSRPDLPDVSHHSHGLSDILKSSFSLFVSSARPRPSNHALLILFVVGGLSLAEVRRMREMIAASKINLQVLLATTQLLTPERTAQNILCTHRTS